MAAAAATTTGAEAHPRYSVIPAVNATTIGSSLSKPAGANASAARRITKTRIAATMAAPIVDMVCLSLGKAWIDRTAGATAKIIAKDGRKVKKVAIPAPANPAAALPVSSVR